MKKSSPLTDKSPISLIRGVGDKRTKVLSELGIYSIKDFLEYTQTPDGVLRVAGTTGMKKTEVQELRSRIEKEIHPVPAKINISKKRFSIFFAVVVVNVFFIALGALIETTSFYHLHRPSYAVTALFDDLDIYQFYELEVISRYNGMYAKTEVILESTSDVCSYNKIPHGILFAYLTDSKLKEIDVVIHVVVQKPKEVEEGWFTKENITELSIPLPVTIEDVSHLENYPGINLIAWIDLEPLKKIKAKFEPTQYYECRFEFRAMYKDNVGATFFDKYRKGIINILTFISYNEAKFIGINDWPDDGLGPFLELDIRNDEYNTNNVFYIWEPIIDGELIQPNDMVGARRFVYIEHKYKPIEARISLRTEGAKLIPYLAGIIGLEIIIVFIPSIVSNVSEFRRR